MEFSTMDGACKLFCNDEAPLKISAIPANQEDIKTQLGSRILVVDDEENMRIFLIHYLKSLGYSCISASNAGEAFEQIQGNLLDLVVTDIDMPGMNGIELLREIKRRDDNLPFVMITGKDDPREIIDAMKTGADDYILKPFDLTDISRGISNSLKRSAMRKQIRAFQNDIQRMLAERTSQVQRLSLNIIQSLITALEQKDSYTNGHSQRVAWLSVNLAKAAGVISREIEHVHIAGILHDLGKIGIRESILSKQGALTEEEYAHVKTHCDIGVCILEPLQEFSAILPLVRHHHEHYDGFGYPMNLKGEEIPLGARILAIADTFDAMISARPYRSALPLDEALLRLRRAAGSQLDPLLVNLFIALVQSDDFSKTIKPPFISHKDIDIAKIIPLTNFPLDIFAPPLGSNLHC
jgi:putative two-component system response regulator